MSQVWKLLSDRTTEDIWEIILSFLHNPRWEKIQKSRLINNIKRGFSLINHTNINASVYISKINSLYLNDFVGMTIIDKYWLVSEYKEKYLKSASEVDLNRFYEVYCGIIIHRFSSRT